MRNFTIAAFATLAFLLPAAATPKNPADYPDAFYVRYMALVDGCIMDVSERNVEYRLIDRGGFSATCFTVGQTIQGRIIGNQLIEFIYTDSKWRKRTVKFQIVSQAAYQPSAH